ncbi:MAG TPA: chromosomal replication initiator protein DnaA, partial [Candidatus Angelobacter sp.]|nr:chromosomal replication initiator protein DnaA [Candidatus Angelobacter sp.]
MASPASSNELQTQWARVRGRLRSEFGEAAYRNWLKKLTLVSLRGSELQLAVPTRFIRDWIGSNYSDRLLALWVTENSAVRTIELVVEAGAKHVEEDRTATGHGGSAAGNGGRSEPGPGEIAKGILVHSLDPRFTFEDFIVGKSNELAYAAAYRVADSATVPFNPLFLYGGVGLGKTHLMHAIAWQIRKRTPQRRVIYLSAEKFMYQFIRAIRHKTTMAFKEQFRSVDVLMIDDLQFISGKDSTQEEFFHTMNEIITAGRRLVITSDRAPQDLDGIAPRILSRLSWGLVADINSADYELRFNIIFSKLEAQPGVDMSRPVIDFLARRVTSSVRELEGALNRIGAYAMMTGREIDVAFVEEVLANVLRANQRRISIDEIQTQVAEHYRIRKAEMTSARRAREVARPRQVAMYLAKQLTQRSLPEIGRKFGGRDHTTVM